MFLTLLAHRRLVDHARPQATGANTHCANCAVRSLMANRLQIWRKTAFCLDVGMADEIANLGFFAAKIALFAHNILPLLKNSLFNLLVYGLLFWKTSREEFHSSPLTKYKRSAYCVF